MPAGLQVMDENGRLVVDLTTRICKFIGTHSVGGSGAPQAGRLTVPQFTMYGNEGFFARCDGVWGSEFRDAVFYIEGDGLNWEFPSPARPLQSVVYGIY